MSGVQEVGQVESQTKLWSFKVSNRIQYTLSHEIGPLSLGLVIFLVLSCLKSTVVWLRVLYILTMFLMGYLIFKGLSRIGDDFITVDAATQSLTCFAERRLVGRRDIEFQRLVSDLTSVNALMMQVRCGKTGGLEILGSREFRVLVPGYMTIQQSMLVADQVTNAIHSMKGIVTA